MSRTAEYKQVLVGMDPRRLDEYLMSESGLPGPRGNLELAWAVCESATKDQVEAWLAGDCPDLGTDHPRAFLTFCGVIALGKLVVEQDGFLETLRGYASDDRWRVRESVAMALQRIGDVDRNRMFEIARTWVSGNMLEARAAIAGIAEPRLLGSENTGAALLILNAATEKIAAAADIKCDAYRILKQALCYCWSVVVAAYPNEGKRAMEKWLASSEADIRKIMKENLKKSRLAKAQPEWTEKWLANLARV